VTDCITANGQGLDVPLFEKHQPVTDAW